MKLTLFEAEKQLREHLFDRRISIVVLPDERDKEYAIIKVGALQNTLSMNRDFYVRTLTEDKEELEISLHKWLMLVKEISQFIEGLSNVINFVNAEHKIGTMDETQRLGLFYYTP